MAKDTSNVKAGIFVVVGIVLMFVVIVVLSDFESMFAPTQKVTVRFGLTDGLKGLKEGATVTIGDHPAGMVLTIGDEEGDDRIITGKLVEFEMPAGYRLYDNAVIKLNPPPLGGGTSLNIESVGYDASSEEQNAILIQKKRVIRLDRDGKPLSVPDDLRRFTDEQLLAQGERVVVDVAGRPRRGESWEYHEHEILLGGFETSPLMADLIREVGIGDLQRRQIQNIIKNADILVAELSKDPQRYSDILANVRSATGRADKALEHVNALMDNSRENLQTAIANVRKIVEDNRDDLRSTIANLQKLMETNRPVIDDTLAYTREVLKRVRDQTMDKITTAVDNASDMLAAARKSMGELDQMVTAQRPVLERMIANMKLASDNMKFAAIEIRRAPWRLLYEPKPEEIDTENLYSAARSFLLAADSMETTVATLKGVMDKHGSQIPADDESVKQLVAKLKQSVEKYSEAEQKFWDALGDQVPQKK